MIQNSEVCKNMKERRDVKYNLQETFNVLDTLYNIHDLENRVLNNSQ